MQDINNELLLTPEEREELSTFTYDCDSQIDEAIDRVKEYNTEIERYRQIYQERVDKLKLEMDFKIEKLNKKKSFELWNIRTFTLNSPNTKETKTQHKFSSLSGDVIIKKSQPKMVKPKLDEDTIKTKYTDYKKEKTVVELDWATMKKDLIIKDGVVINVNTGELAEEVVVEVSPEEIVIK